MSSFSEPESGSGDDASTMQLHGVLIRVRDVGVLIIGESGLGKSECALELVTRGHQLVADDVVVLTVSDAGVIGTAPDFTRELMEIRGLGIINVRELFGEQTVSRESRIDICVELTRTMDNERIGHELARYEVAGTTIPKFTLPVSSGRVPATLVETAVRVYISHKSGRNAAAGLVEKLASTLSSS